MARNLLSVISSIVCFCQLIRVNKATFNYLDQSCVVGSNYTERSVYQRNLNSLLSNLSSKTSTNMFFNSTLGDFPNKVYGLYQCRADLSTSACSECVQDAVQKIVQVCPINKEAIIWYYECILRYANRSIFSIMETYPYKYQWGLVNVSSYGQLAPVLASTMDNIIHQAAAGTALGHFAVGSANWSMFETVYCLAQCTPDISDLDCKNCLKFALNVMIRDYKTSGRVKIFYPSCQLRYDANSYQFYQDIPLAPTPSNMPMLNGPGKSKASQSHVLNIALGVLVVILIVLVTVLVCHLCHKRRMENERQSIRNSRQESYLTNVERRDGFIIAQPLPIDLATLKMATNDFSDDNRLGKGGFGGVYKGTLPNGLDIAVKRLSKDSNQGAEEFQNEVMLVAKLQHRNLVRLLGYCQTPNEMLLAYEFVPNKSLDLILFDPATQGLLDWPMRYKIIHGIARGLQYLHEDSRLKIVHRDLKAGNILLDADMIPKISDFGLARNFTVTQKQDQTSRLVGTLGYMAPEYREYGEISTKSDVYSFGVLVLEIISGKRISDRPSVLAENLLTYAWRHWSQGTASEVIDANLGDSYSSNEIIRCLHLGLLCVQGDIEERPSMLSILFYLNSSYDLPRPQQPAYVTSNLKGSSSGNGELLTNIRSTKSESISRTSLSEKSTSISLHSFSGNEASTH